MELKFKYQSFKRSGKLYDSNCEAVIEIDTIDSNNMYAIQEKIRELHTNSGTDLIWSIGAEDEWFFDTNAQKCNVPMLVGV